MENTQIQEADTKQEFETLAPIELKALLEEWKGGKNAQTGPGSNRTVPHFFDHYFQTFPIGIN